MIICLLCLLYFLSPLTVGLDKLYLYLYFLVPTLPPSLPLSLPPSHLGIKGAKPDTSLL